MKYVFIAHSHTLLLTSLGVINSLRIKEEDVIFICTRNYNADYFPKGAQVIRGDNAFASLNEDIEKGGKEIIKNAIKRFDSDTKSWIREKYQLFVPHLANPFFLLLYHHPLCLKVSFVQEGAFTSPGMFINHRSFVYKLRRKFSFYRHTGSLRLYGSGNWFFDGVLDRQKKLDAYAIYSGFFKYLECDLHIVEWPDLKINLSSTIDGPVFIFDGFVKNHMAEKDFYLAQCETMIENYHGQTNFLKFHPAQSEAERNCICNMFESKGLTFSVMDDKTPFELYILKYNRMTVVGMSSSLLYYAQQRGHKVICCDTWMLKDETYRHYHDEGFPLFHEFFGIETPDINT